MPPEKWKRHPSIKRLYASDWGRLRVDGKPDPTFGSWDITNKRYVIKIAGVNYKVARLVLECFAGLAPRDKPIALHDDEDSRNNRPTNLKWGTVADNNRYPLYRARKAVQASAQSRFMSGRFAKRTNY